VGFRPSDGLSKGRPTMRRCLLVAGLILSTAWLAHAQRPTLRDLVSQAQGDVRVGLSVTSPTPVPFDQLFAQTDYVVTATIGTGTSCLRDDGYDIFTTFTLRDQRVLFARQVFQSQRVGEATPPLTLTQLGGTVSIDGFKVTVSVGDAPQVSEGMDTILFLR